MGDELSDNPAPDFGPWDRVCFRDWPDFVYYVVEIDGDATAVDTEGLGGSDGSVLVPTVALRKVVDDDA